MKRLLMIIPFLLLAASHLGAQEMLDLPSVTLEKIEQLENLHQKAQQQVASGEYRAAMRSYEDIMLLEPDDETVYVAMGKLYSLFSEFRKAETAYINALSINPENEAALDGIKKIRRPDGSSYL